MRILVLIMRGQAFTWETFLFLRVLAHFAPLKKYHKTSVYAQYKRDERSNIVMKLIGERNIRISRTVQEAVVYRMSLFNKSNAKGKI